MRFLVFFFFLLHASVSNVKNSFAEIALTKDHDELNCFPDAQQHIYEKYRREERARERGRESAVMTSANVVALPMARDRSFAQRERETESSFPQARLIHNNIAFASLFVRCVVDVKLHAIARNRLAKEN